MSKNFKNKALMGLAAGLSMTAATAQAGVTNTLAANCAAPQQTRNYNQSRSSCAAPQQQNNNNNNNQASNYGSCSTPKYGYDNATADNTMTRPAGWSNADAQGQMQGQMQGQPGQTQNWTNTQNPNSNTSGWTTQSTPKSSSGYNYYNGQGTSTTTTPNSSWSNSGSSMNPNSTTNPMTTQPSSQGYTR